MNRRGQAQPPLLAVLLVRLSVPLTAREGVVGDLDEEFRAEIAGSRSRYAAWVWYWRQAWSLSLAYSGDAVANRRGFAVGPEDRSDRGEIDMIVQDLKYALRALRKTPIFTVTAVMIIALGIGANTAIFSAVNAVLFRPQPFENPEELVEIYQDSDEGDPNSTSYPAYCDIAAHNDLFSSVAATFDFPVSLQGDDGLRPALVEYATASYLPMLGLVPSAGRWFDPAEDEVGAGAFAVVGHRAWVTRFGQDPNIIGRAVRVNGAPVTIVGIGPRDYNGMISGVAVDFWLSISSMQPVEGAFSAGTLERRQDHWFQVRARLEAGVTPAEAQTAMTALAARLAEEFPNLNAGRDITVYSSADVRVHPAVDASVIPAAAGLMAIVGLVLVIACSNLAILLLVRGASRARDMSIRLAIGANRTQLTRQFLSESVLLSAAGGVLGYLVAGWALDLAMTYQLPGGVPAVLDIGLDGRVLAFTVVLSLGTGFAFGLAPALRASRADVMSALRDEGETLSLGRRWFGLKNALVVFQVAVSVLFLVGAGLFIRSLTKAERIAPGFSVDDVAFMEIDATQAGYGFEESQALYRDLFDRIRSTPGVRNATMASAPPIGGRGSSTMIVEGYVSPEGTGALELPFAFVGPEYFDTLEIPIVRGRAFTAEDREGGPPVMIVNETFAERYWGSTDVIGRRIRHQAAEDSWMEVVGVAGDTKVREVVEPTRSIFYKPFDQSPSASVSFIARSEGDVATIVPGLKSALDSLDSGVPILRTRTMSEHIGESLAISRISAAFLSAFSLLALGLAGLGLYAVVSFGVAERSTEVGIRMALGARSAAVVWMIVREVMTIVAVGLVLGLVLGVAAMSGMTTLLYGVSALDPITLAGVAGLLALVAGVAVYIPAQRTVAGDPLTALRHE